MQERWKGVRPVLWGDAMREADLSYWLYNNLLGYSQLEPNESALATSQSLRATSVSTELSMEEPGKVSKEEVAA